MKSWPLLFPLLAIFAAPAEALEWDRPTGRVGFELSTQGDSSTLWRSLATQNSLSVSLGEDVYFNDCWGLYVSGRLKGVFQGTTREAWGIVGTELSAFELWRDWSFFLTGNVGGPLPYPVFEALQLTAEHPLWAGTFSLGFGGFLTQAQGNYSASDGSWLDASFRRKLGPVTVRVGTTGEIAETATSGQQSAMVTLGAQVPLGLGFSIWTDGEYRFERQSSGTLLNSATLSAGSSWRF